MSGRRLSQLPDAPYKKYAEEALRRGTESTGGELSDATSVILIGALDMIRELYEKIAILESKEEK